MGDIRNINWGTTERILEALKEFGPMTRSEIDDVLNLDKRNTGKCINGCMKESPRKSKRIYIVNWVYDHCGSRRYPRAVYALGNEKDKEKPKRDNKAVQKKYRDKKRRLLTTNSVFNLAKTGFTKHYSEMRLK